MSGILRHSLTRMVPAARSSILQRTVVSAPPKNPMSFMEKMALGGGMCLAIMAPMFYILANVNYYKNPKGNPE